MIEDDIGELVKNGNKIGAIQLLGKQEGLSLKEAKDSVDQYCRE